MSTGPVARSWRRSAPPMSSWTSASQGEVDQHLGSQVRAGPARRGVGHLAGRGELPDDLIFHVTYLGGDMPDFHINFSGPAGQIIAQYYEFIRLGRSGYRRVHDCSYQNGQFLASQIEALGPFELLCDSARSGIPAVTWRIQEGEDPGYSLYDVADRLRDGAGRCRPTR